MADVPYREEAFAKHAAPQAIEAWLKIARVRRREADRRVEWLELLLAKRRGQVERGEWPTAPAVVTPAHEVEEAPSGAIDLMAALRASLKTAKADGYLGPRSPVVVAPAQEDDHG